jgi:hypothetical protein
MVAYKQLLVNTVFTSFLSTLESMSTPRFFSQYLNHTYQPPPVKCCGQGERIVNIKRRGESTPRCFPRNCTGYNGDRTDRARDRFSEQTAICSGSTTIGVGLANSGRFGLTLCGKGLGGRLMLNDNGLTLTDNGLDNSPPAHAC